MMFQLSIQVERIKPINLQKKQHLFLEDHSNVNFQILNFIVPIDQFLEQYHFPFSKFLHYL